METKKGKLKNKKKDIISSEIETPNEPKKEEQKKEEPKEEQISTEPQKESNTEAKPETNSMTIARINKIIYNVQLLFSMHSKIDDKLFHLLVKYLNKDHLKDILEERDCRQICGNILCGKKLIRDKNDKYYYDSKAKDFVKEEIVDFFCDVRCMQKFKDALKISQKFDYFTLARLDALCSFSLLPEYFPDNMYIYNISKFANEILVGMKKDDSELKIYEKKTNDYFEIDNPVIS
jgi:hypothetical protein